MSRSRRARARPLPAAAVARYAVPVASRAAAGRVDGVVLLCTGGRRVHLRLLYRYAIRSAVACAVRFSDRISVIRDPKRKDIFAFPSNGEWDWLLRAELKSRQGSRCKIHILHFKMAEA